MSKNKAALIAAVMVTCYVDGVRTDIQPGGELPPLSEHDEAELKRMGAVRDPAEEAAAEAAERKEERDGQREFKAARNKVLAAESSTKDPAAGGAPEAKT